MSTAVGGRVPARAEKVFARGKPEAKLHGPVLLVLFLPPRKVQVLQAGGIDCEHGHEHVLVHEEDYD